MPYQYKREPLNNDEVDKLTNSCSTFRGKFVVWNFLDTGLKKVSPHVLRHTFAVNCIKKGISTRALQSLLGHDRLATTEIYLNLSPEDAIREFLNSIENTKNYINVNRSIPNIHKYIIYFLYTC